MEKSEALQLAKEQNLDLVLVSKESTPVVCKLEDYKLKRLEQNKKDKALRASNRLRSTKEMYLKAGIDKHDLGIKLKKMIGFLETGSTVKLTIIDTRRAMKSLTANDNALDVEQVYTLSINRLWSYS